MLNKNFQKWFNSQKKLNKIRVKIKRLNDLENWNYGKKLIFHNSRRFFKIIGIEVKSNFAGKNWDQPIIVQNEQGILGIIKNKKTKKYLLQAKVEPGNKNKLQLSPTVQATKSNYQRIHKGKKTPYLNFFKDNKVKFTSQSEQGYRYLSKFNKNSIVVVEKKIKVLKNFFWFSREDLKYLIKRKSVLNMDTVSVFSSFIRKNTNDLPHKKMREIKNWIRQNDKIFKLKIKVKPLANLINWKVTPDNITHKNNKHFSVIGINTLSNKREVTEWDQPIIKGKRIAFAGYLIKEFNKTEHYLCKYNKKPGLKKSTLSCTANTSDLDNFKTNNNLNSFEKKMIRDIFLNKKNKYKKIYDNILSDEGGRFFNCEIKYKVLKLHNKTKVEIPSNYFWISRNQMIEMIKRKKVDIEARLLFACANIDKII